MRGRACSTLFSLFELCTSISTSTDQNTIPRSTKVTAFPSIPPPCSPPSKLKGKIEIEQIGFRHNRSCQFSIDSNSRCRAISRFRLPSYVRRCAIPTDEILPSMVLQVLGAVVRLNVFACDRLVKVAQDQQGEFGRGRTCLHDFLCYFGSKLVAYVFAPMEPVTGADLDFERREEWKFLYQVLN